MVDTLSTCSVCNRRFAVRFRFQVRESGAGFSYFCSQLCQQRSLGLDVDGGERQASPAVAPLGEVRALAEVERARVVRPIVVPPPARPVASEELGRCSCDVCGARFSLEFPFQVVVSDRGAVHFCSMACRDAARRGAREPARGSVRAGGGPRRIAVFNHKGGTGKTTTAVSLAAGLAESGQRVLVVDADGQGNVGASLGIRGEHTLYHVLVQGMSADLAAVPVREGLDVLTSNELLAAAELHLATRPNRDRVMRERLGDRVVGYDVVVIDCAPALSLMNQNALVYADSVLIPVACDYLSLVGVKQVLRTLKHVRDLLKHDVAVLGVLPTFHDARAKIARDALDALREHFGDRCLSPIRASTKLREAPSVRKTIFEHAPDSGAADDYRKLVEHVRRLRGDPCLIDREPEREATPARSSVGSIASGSPAAEVRSKTRQVAGGEASLVL